MGRTVQACWPPASAGAPHAGRGFGDAQRGGIGGAQLLEAAVQQRQATEAGGCGVEHHVPHGGDGAGRQGGQEKDALHHQPHLARQKRHGAFGTGGAHACGSGG
jgi:hypothetical protein